MNELQLETERLFLRPPLLADAGAHFELMADPLTSQFLTPDGKPQSREIAWRIWAMLSGHWNLRGFGFFSVIEKSSGAWAGRVGPWYPEGWPEPEIGWGIHPAFRGKGYALEAAVATARWTLNSLGRDQIISLVRPANTNSQRVATKLGEGITGTWTIFGAETDIWSMSRQAFGEKWGL